MTKGLYLHIPFCERKCNYCDFYSGAFSDETKQRYIDKLTEEIEKWGRLNSCPIDTIYFGGGTPSLLSPSQLEQILSSVRTSFNIQKNAEITAEVNPADNPDFISAAARLGINRLSLGIESSNDSELKLLGRRHTFADAVKTVDYAQKCGITNISGDLMLGLPDSTVASFDKSISDILSLSLNHISAYILKLEKNTLFYKNRVAVPDDDEVAEQYLHMCNVLKQNDYGHYEISNFAKDGYQSRHNNKYWMCREYIGIGPAAHSFFEGKRFYYPRNIKGFINDPKTVADGDGGDSEEFIMLALRLSRGLIFEEYEARFGKLPQKIIKRASLLSGLCTVDDKAIRLTDRGMLLSNSIITEVLK